jgi:eukaryotic-like serine/threonine-protein kinase
MREDLPALGSTVGPWLILERLDSGSFGVVFRARRAGPPESPPVALKVAKWTGDPRFERETAALQSCHHPSIPRYEDSGQWTGPKGHSHPYVAMEWVQGATLYHWFRNGKRSSRDVLKVVAHLAGALASAHSRGVIHRDVKGDNIRVTPEGRAVLLDWGSCWLPSARPLTDTPAPPGTHAYRPPEQRGFMHTFRMDMEARWESRPSDDLYALGVTLYRLVTGSYLPPCTDGDGLVERKVLEPSAMATVSPALEAIILRLISDDPKAWGTAERLVREAMALVQAGGPSAQKPILPTPSAQPTDYGPPSSNGPHDEELPSESDSDTEPASTRGEHPSAPVFPSWAGAFVMGSLVMALLVLLVRPAPEEPHPPWIATPEEVAQFAPDAGVGEEALASFQNMPRAVLPPSYLGLRMPKEPIPGQKKPPCEPDIQKVINGGCWVGPLGTRKPPCGSEAFDYDDGCYMPVFPPPRQPASGTP